MKGILKLLFFCGVISISRAQDIPQDSKKIDIFSSDVEVSYKRIQKDMSIYSRSYRQNHLRGLPYSGNHLFTTLNTTVVNFQSYNLFDLRMTIDTNLSGDLSDTERANLKVSLARLITEKFGLSLIASLGNYEMIRSGVGADSFKFGAITPVEINITKQFGGSFIVDATIVAGVTQGLAKNMDNSYLPSDWVTSIGSSRYDANTGPKTRTGLYLNVGNQARYSLGQKMTLGLGYNYSLARGTDVKEVRGFRTINTDKYKTKLSMFDYNAELSFNLGNILNKELKNNTFMIGYNSTLTNAKSEWSNTEVTRLQGNGSSSTTSTSTPSSLVKNQFDYLTIGFRIGL